MKKIIKNKNIQIGGGLFVISIILNLVFDISFSLISYILFAIGIVVGFIILAMKFLEGKNKYYKEETKSEFYKEEDSKIQEEIKLSLKTNENHTKSTESKVTSNMTFIEAVKADIQRKLIFPGFAAFFIGKGGSLIGIYGIPILNLGEGFSGTANLFNSLVTYFPIFFIMFNFQFVKDRIGKNKL